MHKVKFSVQVINHVLSSLLPQKSNAIEKQMHKKLLEGKPRKRGKNRELLSFWSYSSEIGSSEGNKFQGDKYKCFICITSYKDSADKSNDNVVFFLSTLIVVESFVHCGIMIIF